MNENHAKLCASRRWAEQLQTEILAPVASGVDLGDEILEVGPGPGAATDWLRTRVRRLVAVEYERSAADALAERFAGTNVEVVHGDATALSFADASFDSVASFTMLHHLPTRAAQTRLLAEVHRVLRPGGVLVGSDSVHSDELQRFHEGDTYNPVEAADLLAMLQALRFCDITITIDTSVKFVGHRPWHRSLEFVAPSR